MDVAAWCRQSRVWVVAGKGGVGKTTVSAALAYAAAGAGLSVLVVELEGKSGLGRAFGRDDPLGYLPVPLGGPGEPPATGGPRDGGRGVEAGARDDGDGTADDGGGPADDSQEGVGGHLDPGTVWARRLTPDDALLEYLDDHGLRRVSKRLASSGVLDVVATAIPGIRDVLVLGKVKQIERAGLADVVVLDAPATGHAMTFLTSAGGLLDAARGGPVRSQATEVVELLQDPARCRVLPVTLPEEMPVSETIEAARALEERVGVRLGPIVVNCFETGPAALGTDTATAARESGAAVSKAALRALEGAREFRLRRLELVDEQVGRLGRELPLPQLRLPRLWTPSIGPEEVHLLAGAFAEQVADMAPGVAEGAA